MAVSQFFDISVTLTSFKQYADRLWLDTPPQSFMQNRYQTVEKK